MSTCTSRTNSTWSWTRESSWWTVLTSRSLLKTWKGDYGAEQGKADSSKSVCAYLLEVSATSPLLLEIMSKSRHDATRSSVWDEADEMCLERLHETWSDWQAKHKYSKRWLETCIRNMHRIRCWDAGKFNRGVRHRGEENTQMKSQSTIGQALLSVTNYITHTGIFADLWPPAGRHTPLKCSLQIGDRLYNSICNHNNMDSLTTKLIGFKDVVEKYDRDGIPIDPTSSIDHAKTRPQNRPEGSIVDGWLISYVAVQRHHSEKRKTRDTYEDCSTSRDMQEMLKYRCTFLTIRHSAM